MRLSILLATLLFFPANLFASNDGERASGIVKPTVSVLSHSESSGKPIIEEYRLPTKYVAPFGIGVDSKDRIWFTEMAGNSLAVFNPAKSELKEYRIPSTKDLPTVDWEYDPKKRDTPEKLVTNYSVGNPGNLIVTKDDVIWFVMLLGNSIVRFDPEKEEFTEYLIPTENAQPYDLAIDSNGVIWFIEKNSGKLGYLDINKKKISELNLGNSANPMGILVDADDNVWIGDVSGNYIGRYNPKTKSLLKNQINVPQAQPGNMRLDSEGRIWFGQLHSKQIGVFIPDPGIFSVADVPGFNAVPQAIIPANDDKIWYVDSMMNRVGYFNTVELNWGVFPIPSGNSQPMGIAIDSKGDIWFTQSDRVANGIARVVRSTVPEGGSKSGGGATSAGHDHGDGDMPAGNNAGQSGDGISAGAIAGIAILVVVAFGIVAILGRRSKE